MTRRGQIVGVSALVLAAASALSGCSVSACPAVLYLSDVEVHTSGEFATLEACVAGDCVSSADTPSGDGLFGVTSDGENSWTIGSFQGSPAKMTLRTRDDAGKMIAEEVVELEWTRAGGSEQCGGPMETPAVEFGA